MIVASYISTAARRDNKCSHDPLLLQQIETSAPPAYTMAIVVSEDGTSEYQPSAEKAINQLEDPRHHIGVRKRLRKESNAKENNGQQRKSTRLCRKKRRTGKHELDAMISFL
jgi:hypothetical protein